MIPKPLIHFLKIDDYTKAFLELTVEQLEMDDPHVLKLVNDMVDEEMEKLPDNKQNRAVLTDLWVVLYTQPGVIRIFNVDPNSAQFAISFPDALSEFRRGEIEKDQDVLDELCEDKADYDDEDCEICEFQNICPLYREMKDIESYEEQLKFNCSAGACDRCKVKILCPTYYKTVFHISLN